MNHKRLARFNFFADGHLAAMEICQRMGEVTADRLKRQAILGEMMALVPDKSKES
jgi:hypothetical protein